MPNGLPETDRRVFLIGRCLSCLHTGLFGYVIPNKTVYVLCVVQIDGKTVCFCRTHSPHNGKRAVLFFTKYARTTYVVQCLVPCRAIP